MGIVWGFLCPVALFGLCFSLLSTLFDVILCPVWFFWFQKVHNSPVPVFHQRSTCLKHFKERFVIGAFQPALALKAGNILPFLHILQMEGSFPVMMLTTSYMGSPSSLGKYCSSPISVRQTSINGRQAGDNIPKYLIL